MHRRTLGVWLVPKPQKSYLKYKEELKYEVVVGYSTKGLHRKDFLFVSNPAIRERINELRLKPGSKTGYVIYQTDHHFKYIAAPWFVPETYVPRPKEQNVKLQRYYNQFQGTGFGSMIEVLALKALIRAKPNTSGYHFQGSMDDNPLREAHYQKREINFHTRPTIPDVIQTTKKHLIRGYRKWKAKKRGTITHH